MEYWLLTQHTMLDLSPSNQCGMLIPSCTYSTFLLLQMRLLNWGVHETSVLGVGSVFVDIWHMPCSLRDSAKITGSNDFSYHYYKQIPTPH